MTEMLSLETPLRHNLSTLTQIVEKLRTVAEVLTNVDNNFVWL